jgi:hypothetical protein
VFAFTGKADIEVKGLHFRFLPEANLDHSAHHSRNSGRRRKRASQNYADSICGQKPELAPL